MAKFDKEISRFTQSKSQPNWLKQLFLVVLLLLALSLALIVLCSPRRAMAAQGSVQVLSQGADLNVAISQASSDDPPNHNDPGQGLDVAECRLSLERGKRVNISIFSAYPGYTCTLHIAVHNRSNQAVRLQDAQINTSPGLRAIRLNDPGTVLISAGETGQRVFQIHILGQATEQAQLEFQIVEVYVQAEASLSTR